MCMWVLRKEKVIKIAHYYRDGLMSDETQRRMRQSGTMKHIKIDDDQLTYE